MHKLKVKTETLVRSTINYTQQTELNFFNLSCKRISKQKGRLEYINKYITVIFGSKITVTVFAVVPPFCGHHKYYDQILYSECSPTSYQPILCVFLIHTTKTTCMHANIDSKEDEGIKNIKKKKG